MIIAFEGPSGAGKDYKKNNWLNTCSNALHTITRQQMGRVVDKAAGGYMSSADDYAAIAVATMDQTRDVVVDRFLLSRPVYWAMRFNRSELHRDWYFQVRASLDNMRSMAISEAYNRCVSDEVIFIQPEVEISIILPTIEVLNHRRSLTGKSYPYDGATELQLYTTIAFRLLQQPLRGVTVRVIE